MGNSPSRGVKGQFCVTISYHVHCPIGTCRFSLSTRKWLKWLAQRDYKSLLAIALNLAESQYAKICNKICN